MKQNRKNKKYGLLTMLAILLFICSEDISYSRFTDCRLEYLNNRLSVNAEKVTLGSLLSEIGEMTGIEFLLHKEESERIISVRFQSLSIDRALDKILSQLNYAVIYGPEGKIKEVTIVGKSNEVFKSREHRPNKVSTSSNIMKIGNLSKEGMKINQTLSRKSLEDMNVKQSSKALVTEKENNHHTPKEAVTEGLRINQTRRHTAQDGLKIFHSSDKKIYKGLRAKQQRGDMIPGGMEKGQFTNNVTLQGMNITTPSDNPIPGGMKTGSSPDGVIPDGMKVIPSRQSKN